MRFIGAKTKRAAVVTALAEFNRRRKMAELVKYSGTFTSMPSNEEIEGLELARMKRIFGEDFEFTPPATAKRILARGKQPTQSIQRSGRKRT